MPLGMRQLPCFQQLASICQCRLTPELSRAAKRLRLE
jgi:hypothetical protein